MEQLLSCPFCNSSAKLIRNTNQFIHTYGVICTNKNCIGYDIVPRYLTKKCAIDSWNGVFASTRSAKRMFKKPKRQNP